MLTRKQSNLHKGEYLILKCEKTFEFSVLRLKKVTLTTMSIDNFLLSSLETHSNILKQRKKAFMSASCTKIQYFLTSMKLSGVHSMCQMQHMLCQSINYPIKNSNTNIYIKI